MKRIYVSIIAIVACSCSKEDKPGKDQEFADFTTNWTSCWGTGVADDFSGSVIDNSGNMYFVGASEPDGYAGNIFLTKVSLSNQTASWSKKFNSGEQDLFWSPSQNGHANGGGGSRCIGIDDAGNVYIAGSVVDGFSEVFIMKIDASGNVLWETRWEANAGGLANGEAKAYAIDVSGTKVFVTGSTVGMTFLLSLDQATGSVQPETIVGFDASPGYNDMGYTIKSIDGDIVYIAGWEGANNSAVLYKFSGGGATFEWQEKIAVGTAHRITDIDLDASGNIYLAVDFRGVSTFIGVMKLNPDGSLVWAKKFQGESNDRNNISSLRILNNQIFIGGRGSYTHYDTGQFGDGTFLNLDLNGTVLHVYNYFSEYNTGERIEAIHYYNGSFIIAGETWSEDGAIEGKWYIPQINESTFSPDIEKLTSIYIDAADGVTSTGAMTVSSISQGMYAVSEGSKGSADVMIHSITF